MREREEITKQAEKYTGITGGMPGITRILFVILEVILDIREILRERK